MVRSRVIQPTARKPRKSNIPVMADPAEAAQAAGLRYYTDAGPGIRRKRAGKGFAYLDTDGQPIRDREELRRIKALAIPPAWTDVWICPTPRGHIQATGRDARGRKQYRYHPDWRKVRDETKYHRMIAFGEALPVIRERVDHDLSSPCLSRDKVVATVVRLLDETAIRVGNEEYARENHSFGLTTLRRRHVDISGSALHFHFRGKGGKEHVVDVRDRRLARAVQRCEHIPGYELFQYLDEQGQRHAVDSGDVNDYLRELSGDDFTAKDFRTWHGTVVAACTLHEIGGFESETQAKKNIGQAVEAVAEYLGNTPTIARKSYIHPGVIEGYLDGTLLAIWDREARKAESQPDSRLSPDEIATLALLRGQMAEQTSQARAG